MGKNNSPFTAKSLINFLESNNIETRPIMSGDFTQHPVNDIFDHRIIGDLKTTKNINSNGFFIGIHAGITNEQREYVVSKFKEFLLQFKKD